MDLVGTEEIVNIRLQFCDTEKVLLFVHLNDLCFEQVMWMMYHTQLGILYLATSLYGLAIFVLL